MVLVYSGKTRLFGKPPRCALAAYLALFRRLCYSGYSDLTLDDRVVGTRSKRTQRQWEGPGSTSTRKIGKLQSLVKQGTDIICKHASHSVQILCIPPSRRCREDVCAYRRRIYKKTHHPQEPRHQTPIERKNAVKSKEHKSSTSTDKKDKLKRKKAAEGRIARYNFDAGSPERSSNG